MAKTTAKRQTRRKPVPPEELATALQPGTSSGPGDLDPAQAAAIAGELVRPEDDRQASASADSIDMSDARHGPEDPDEQARLQASFQALAYVDEKRRIAGQRGGFALPPAIEYVESKDRQLERIGVYPEHRVGELPIQIPAWPPQPSQDIFLDPPAPDGTLALAPNLIALVKGEYNARVWMTERVEVFDLSAERAHIRVYGYWRIFRASVWLEQSEYDAIMGSQVESSERETTGKPGKPGEREGGQ